MAKKTENYGPMDKVIKEERDNLDGESSQSPNLQPVAEPCDKLVTSLECTSSLTQSEQGLAPVPPGTQEEEPHTTHSFKWGLSGENPTTCTCKKAGTIEESLMSSPKFRVIAGKNQNKELVIVRDGKALSSHFPCSLIKNERLNVKYFKAVDEPKQQVSGQRKRPSGELVMFNVLTKGGKNVKNIMRNPALKTEIHEMTVYAYKGEKVKQALRRDGRFLKILFRKNCELSDMSTEVTTEMSSFVDDLDGQTFKIILLDKSILPDSPPGSLDDAYLTQIESQTSDANGNQDPAQQSTSAESVNDNTSKEKHKTAPEKLLIEMPNSKELKDHLSSQFQHLVKGKKTQQGSKLSRIQNLFRVEYGKNDQTCREVKTMRKLMDLSNSVCQVRINGGPKGSGFLLFGKFVLTNAHVVKGIFDMSTGQLHETVTVHFSFESLDQMDSGAKVEEVAGFERSRDESGHMYDWALLRLSANQEVPDCLLTRFGFLPQSGGICIIGHPYCGVKKVDPCLIVLTENRNQVVGRHHRENPQGVLPENRLYSENQGNVQLVTHRFFEGVAKELNDNRQFLTYESCFYCGSSGSPVFDEHCNVVAMHSGGYAYRNARGERQTVVEFGHPLSVIIERIIVQLVEKGKFDVVKEYLACSYAHEQQMRTNLKKLVERKNVIAFQNAVSNSVVRDDGNLRTFFEFIWEPVPMDV